MIIDDDNDFGFSLVSETELRQKEAELAKALASKETVIKQQATAVATVAATSKTQLDELRNMIMPLLSNLSADANKTYIFWPDRVAKIKKFIDKINTYVDTANKAV